MKIVFMGTPDFAVPSLKELVEAGYDVAAVVTQPAKPKGRGKSLLPTPEMCIRDRLNTEDNYYEVVESNTEDFMGPGEYVVEAVWEGIELEFVPADGTGGVVWDFDQEGQQLKLELHKGDKLTVTSLDGQYNYFRLYEIQQYDE